jgi:hypothetical protein
MNWRNLFAALLATTVAASMTVAPADAASIYNHGTTGQMTLPVMQGATTSSGPSVDFLPRNIYAVPGYPNQHIYVQYQTYEQYGTGSFSEDNWSQIYGGVASPGQSLRFGRWNDLVTMPDIFYRGVVTIDWYTAAGQQIG